MSTPAKKPRRLTEKEARLVEVIVQAASRGVELTREQAGSAAGYGRGEVARVGAHRALARPEVRTALTEALRETASVDAAGAYAIVRHLARKASSDRVRLDAAVTGLRIGGVDMQSISPSGPSITLNLALPPNLTALVTQAAESARRSVIEHEPDGDQ